MSHADVNPGASIKIFYSSLSLVGKLDLVCALRGNYLVPVPGSSVSWSVGIHAGDIEIAMSTVCAGSTNANFWVVGIQ